MKKICAISCIVFIFLSTFYGCFQSESEQKPPFSSSELSHIFSMSYEDVINLYGSPNDETSRQLYDGYFVKNLTFNNALFVIDSQKDKVLRVEFSDDKIHEIRNLSIGSSLNDVLNAYENSGDIEMRKFGDMRYRLLYGDYGNLNDFGIIAYDQDHNPVYVEHMSGIVYVVYTLKDRRVSYISYNSLY